MTSTPETLGRNWHSDHCQVCTKKITWSPRYGWRHDDRSAQHQPTPITPGKVGHQRRE